MKWIIFAFIRIYEKRLAVCIMYYFLLSSFLELFY